eukprot:353516-Chlamydomonas_euryale.AAC.5
MFAAIGPRHDDSAVSRHAPRQPLADLRRLAACGCPVVGLAAAIVPGTGLLARRPDCRPDLARQPDAVVIGPADVRTAARTAARTAVRTAAPRPPHSPSAPPNDPARLGVAVLNVVNVAKRKWALPRRRGCEAMRGAAGGDDRWGTGFQRKRMKSHEWLLTNAVLKR